MATRDNEMQRLKVRDVEEIGHARILGNAGNSARALSTCAGTSSSMVAGGSAAAANGKASSKSKVNPNSTNGHAIANEAVQHAWMHMYRSRKVKKRDFRSLWIQRINAAAREHGLTYGQFMAGLKAAGSTLDRKSLSELAISSPAAFAKLAKTAAGAKPKAAARS